MQSLMSGLFSLAKYIAQFLKRSSAGSATPASSPASLPASSVKTGSMAWGAKVSPQFRATVADVCLGIGVNPDYLMACMAFESAETFRADIRNAAGSGAVGLIQFMPATAKGLGTTVEALAAMTPVEQLDYVRLYFKPYAGRLHTLSDVYMAILWPKAIGEPEDYVLWQKGTSPTTYRQNAGLDVNDDHAITKAEAASLVQAKLERGRLPGNLWSEA